MQCLSFLSLLLMTGRNFGARVLQTRVPKTLSKGWSPGTHQLDEVKLFCNHNNYPGTYCVPGTSYRFLFMLSYKER